MKSSASMMRAMALRAVLVLSLLFGHAAIAPDAGAGWLSRIAGGTEGVGTRAARHAAGALDNAALHVRKLPASADAVLAAQATQEGHWRFVNRAGETFTAGTPEELKRVATVLLPEAKPDAKLALYVTEETLFEQRAALKALPKGTQLNLVAGGEAYRILERANGPALGQASRLFAEVRPSLVVELGEHAPFAEALWQLNRPLNRANVRVLALEPGGPSTLASSPRIDAATGRAVADIIDPTSLPAAMGSIRGQTVLVTGRVDGPLLYVKPSSGPERSVLVRDLLAAAEEADVNLLVLQSTATPRQPGGRNWFWQKVEVKGLDEALRRARMADFLNALAGPNGRLAVVATPAGTLRTALDIKAAPTDLPGRSAMKPIGDVFSDLVADVAGRVLTTSVQGNVRSAERQQELDMRLVPGIPSPIQIVYLAMVVVGLMGISVARGWWRRVWPPEQAGEYARRSGYWAARIVRGAIFLLVFLPLTAPLSVPVAIFTQIWDLLTLPVRIWRWVLRRRTPADGVPV